MTGLAKRMVSSNNICTCNIKNNIENNIHENDFLIAGDNFGKGDDREEAAVILKNAGVRAVLAKSFSKLFYRSAINNGLYVFECDTMFIDDMDELELDLNKFMIKNSTRGVHLDIKPLPKILLRYMEKGGTIDYLASANSELKTQQQ